jgi:adenosylcobinamide-GDP ribazoletransferase
MAHTVPFTSRSPAWAPPLLAVQFLTRIPVPVLANLSREQVDDGLARAMAWLPLVGTLIGLTSAAVFVVASMVWPAIIAALLSLGVEVLLTGFFHEDAVADFFDAFGGTARGENALRIMRDSRIGSYGTVGLTLALGLRVAAFVTLSPSLVVAAVIAAATIGRLWAVLLNVILPPPSSDGDTATRMGRSIPRSCAVRGVLLAIPGCVPLALIRPGVLLLSAAIGLAFLLWIVKFLRDRIGGSTGDCLGFATYAGQLSVLLIAAAG